MIFHHARTLKIGSLAVCILLMQGCTSMPDPAPITLTFDSTSTQATTAPTRTRPTELPYTATRPPTIAPTAPSTALATVTPIQSNTPVTPFRGRPTDTPAPASIPADMTTPTDVASDAALAPVKQNEDWTPVERDFDGVPMVLVPIGCFMMGGEGKVAAVESLPVHQQCVGFPFWIDKYEVSNEQFERVYSGITRVWEGALQPYEGGGWVEARNVCAARGGRLPTEKEWEYAARGPSSWMYPWGNEWNQDNDIWRDTALDAPTSVQMLDASQSWVGAYHMAGNAAEWTSSEYLDYPYSDSSTDTSTSDSSAIYTQHVIRGLARIEVAATFSRMGGNFNIGGVGFRCVRGFG